MGTGTVLVPIFFQGKVNKMATMTASEAQVQMRRIMGSQGLDPAITLMVEALREQATKLSKAALYGGSPFAVRGRELDAMASRLDDNRRRLRDVRTALSAAWGEPRMPV